MSNESANPYTPPQAELRVKPTAEDYGYAGFWIRVGASLIDAVLVVAVTLPLSLLIYGEEYFLSDKLYLGVGDIIVNYVLPAVAVIVFWRYRAATPGKMAFKLRIVNARDRGPMSIEQIIGRYFAYIPSILLFGLGVLWVAWDAKKQGWHDKLAGTLVLRPPRDS